MLKTPNKFVCVKSLSQKGLTLIELAFAVFLLAIILSFIYLKVNPAEFQKRARDNKRLADIAKLERAIAEYKVDNESYPGTANTLMTSTSLPLGNLGPFHSTIDGWIDANFAVYFSNLPIDPINDAEYFYSYYHNNYTYEVNARLEILFEKAQEDGGDDDTVYEVGDNLTNI